MSRVTGFHPERRSLVRRLLAGFNAVLSLLLVITVTVLIVPVTLQIFSRYTDLIPSYIWTEEMARFLFIWTIMIGAMIGVREGSHFEVDFWPQLRPRPAAAVRLVAHFGVLIIAVVFVWAGIEFTRFAWHRTSELADLPLWMIHIAWPVTGASWLLFCGEHIYDDIGVLAGRAPAIPDVKAVDMEARAGGHE